MRPARHFCFFTAALLTLVAPAAEIRVTGSDLLGDSFTRAVAEYARQNDTVVKLDLRGTRPGRADLTAGRADVGLFLLPAGEPPPGDPLVSRVIAYQVAVVVVPVASPLRQVTTAQLRGVFALSAGDAFSRWGELNLIGEWTSRSIALRALSPAAEVAGLRVLALAASPTDPAYAPTAENVHSGGYPLRMPLYVTFSRQAAPDLQLFLKFLLADEAAAALAPAHFVPLPLGARNQLVFELEEMR